MATTLLIFITVSAQLQKNQQRLVALCNKVMWNGIAERIKYRHLVGDNLILASNTYPTTNCSFSSTYTPHHSITKPRFHKHTSHLVLNTQNRIQAPFWRGIIKGMHSIFQPKPAFQLRHLEDFFLMYNPLLEDNKVPLFPNTLHHNHSHTFLHHILWKRAFW